ncbi:MAG: c-type cytochrome, partial [Burkholderiales bacterium]|nr:c-type cytochrome [Burkholderiales bacterium]
SRDAASPIARFAWCLEGGDAERGRQVFFERIEVSCVRCHKVNDVGGEVGPDLSQVAREKDRQYLLEAIVLPNKTVAEEF